MNLLAAEMTARTGRDPGRALSRARGRIRRARVHPDRRPGDAGAKGAALETVARGRHGAAPRGRADHGAAHARSRQRRRDRRPQGRRRERLVRGAPVGHREPLQAVCGELPGRAASAARSSTRREQIVERARALGGMPGLTSQSARVRRSKVCQPPRSHCILRIAGSGDAMRDGRRNANYEEAARCSRHSSSTISGQSLWLDNITRELITTGTLAALHRRMVGDRTHVESRRSSIRRSRAAPRTMRRSARSSRRASRAKRSSSTWRRRTSRQAADLFLPVHERTARRRRLGIARSLAAPRVRHARPRSPRRASSMRGPGGAIFSSRSRERRKGCPRSRRRSSPAFRST